MVVENGDRKQDFPSTKRDEATNSAQRKPPKPPGKEHLGGSSPSSLAESAAAQTKPAVAIPIADSPGVPVRHPVILWIGAGSFFRRIAESATFKILLDNGASLSVIDIRPKSEVRELPCHPNVKYFDVSEHAQRKDLLYNRLGEQDTLFTHCYVANWPQAHILTAVKYSGLCSGGDIIITKPLDLNIPLVETIHSGVFPDIHDKILVDDHYRNKGSIRALHRILPNIQKDQGKLRGFRMWLVEPKTVEEENRLEALECGVIWDLATHLISLIQLFFLDWPRRGLGMYDQGSPTNIRGVRPSVNKVLRMKYIDCRLKNPDAETLAVIELGITFQYKTYADWTDANIDGLLVVGKGPVCQEGVDRPVKQVDLWFEGGHVNLNLDEGRILPAYPEFDDVAGREEKGFFNSVIELLTHSYRKLRARDPEAVQTPPSPGRYHCGVSFEQAYQNVMLINEIRRCAPVGAMLRSYHQKEPIRRILERLTATDHLAKGWLDFSRYGDFI